jgi:hypothetical protein
MITVFINNIRPGGHSVKEKMNFFRPGWTELCGYFCRFGVISTNVSTAPLREKPSSSIRQGIFPRRKARGRATARSEKRKAESERALRGVARLFRRALAVAVMGPPSFRRRPPVPEDQPP